MRQRLSEKNVSRLAGKLGLDIMKVLVRGGTGHRRDLILRDGSMKHLWPDGRIEDSDDGCCMSKERAGR